MMNPEVVPEPPVHEEEMRPPNEDENELRILDSSVGDKRIKWKPKDTKSIAKAKAKFEELRAKGYAFFRITRVRVKADEFPTLSGEVIATKKQLTDLAEGEQIRKFEVATKETVAIPPRSGG